jgi:hypothetical protein
MSVSVYRVQCEHQWFLMALTVFNAVVRLCVLEIQPAFKRCLNVPSTVKGHVQLTKCKRWKKVKPFLKLYLMDLLKVRIVGTLQLLSDKAPLQMLLCNLYILLQVQEFHIYKWCNVFVYPLRCRWRVRWYISICCLTSYLKLMNLVKSTAKLAFQLRIPLNTY